MMEDDDQATRITAEQATVRRQRLTTQARRIQPTDTALVERTTQVLSVVALMDADTRAVTTLESNEGAPIAPVTIVPGTALVLARPALRARRGKRSWMSGVAVWAAALLIIVGTLAAVAPLAGRLTRQRFTPRGAQLTSNGSPVQLTGPWDASAGAINYLGDGGGAGPGVHAPGTAGLPVAPQHTAAPPSQPPSSPQPTGGVSAPPVSPWPPSNPYMFVPGHPGYAFAEPNPDPYWWAFGQCTWWAQYERQDENLKHMGNAQYWASVAATRGYGVGSAPAAGATAVFQPGVQGAGGAGHVAHVIAVYPSGWFLISEMNFYWNGGGWGRIDYRFAHTGWGVSFIY